MFLRASAFDYILVLVVSTALAFTVSYGFYSAPDLRQNVALIAVVCAVLLVPLYAGGWSKRALPLSAVGYVLLAAGSVAVISSLSPTPADLFVDGQINDVEENFAVFGIVIVLVPPVVYLLSRRTWGVAVLFFLGVLACGTIQFLYRDWISSQPGTAAALVTYVGIGALFVMQGYRSGVMKSHVVKKTSFSVAFALGVAGSFACMAVGALVFLTIISGLGLTTVDIKPFEDYYSRPVVEYNGTYTEQQIDDPDQTTDELNENMDQTNDQQDGSHSDQNFGGGGGFSLVSAVVDTLNTDEWQETFTAIRFDMPLPLKLLLWLLVPAFVAALVYSRLRLRDLRLRKIEQRPCDERVALLYNFFMNRFARMKVEKPPAATPLEFAVSSAGELAGFTRNESHADLLGITLIYQRAVYGAGNVTEADYRYVRDYYRAFFKNAHLRMGHPRWILRGFWRI
jgi:hypothetical protein